MSGRSGSGAPGLSGRQEDGRLSAPAAARNMAPIADVLGGLLAGRSGTALEIGSGTGEHVAHWAARLPRLAWQPSDPDPDHRISIAAWAAEAGAGNLRAPLALDAREAWPDLGPLAAVIAVNVIHISPWPVAEAIVAGAGRHLETHGMLILYGPFREGGAHTAESNAAFDASLRARDPGWGVRDLEDVAARAAAAGFGAPQVHRMPANNLTVAFTRL